MTQSAFGSEIKCDAISPWTLKEFFQAMPQKWAVVLASFLGALGCLANNLPILSWLPFLTLGLLLWERSKRAKMVIKISNQLYGENTSKMMSSRYEQKNNYLVGWTQQEYFSWITMSFVLLSCSALSIYIYLSSSYATSLTVLYDIIFLVLTISAVVFRLNSYDIPDNSYDAVTKAANKTDWKLFGGVFLIYTPSIVLAVLFPIFSRALAIGGN